MSAKKPDWDEYFLIDIVPAIAKRASCDRGRSSAIIVRDNRIITTGYVGSPPGLPHCDDVGHLIHTVTDEEGKQSKHCVRTLHAEENAILQAAKIGLSVDKATLYCKLVPCFRCAMKIAAVGIVRVVAQKRYHADRRSIQIFKEAEVKLEIFEDSVELYAEQ